MKKLLFVFALAFVLGVTPNDGPVPPCTPGGPADPRCPQLPVK
jgi:hypothetical protein